MQDKAYWLLPKGIKDVDYKETFYSNNTAAARRQSVSGSWSVRVCSHFLSGRPRSFWADKMLQWRVIVASWWCVMVVMVVVVKGAPAAGSSHPTTTPHPIEDIVHAVLQSDTVSAMDEAAARLTTAVGQVVDDLGDFVVDRVKDLPQTIKEVSDRVSHAVTEGSERVVIMVKGVRQEMQNHTAGTGNTVTNTVDRVRTAANTSQTLASLQDLQERMTVSLTRIFGSLFVNLDKIDTAMADSIRQFSGGHEEDEGHSSNTRPTAPSAHDNEIKVIF
ncbi:hypothetical protein Pmani_008891 [Petrolisthes manimaculis]|uniref:Uncharacterized protein n=1 Tax=Petrolisthes manimaculis TaxID=1843537 RepID=A0AAE1UIH4_9EUCA|nr:hypothetical protein Pmani_008891 [Petrolisthes manimaculis]